MFARFWYSSSPVPRPLRIATGNVIYHVLNRAQGGRTIFENNLDYLAFENTMREAKEIVPMRILAYCLMPNHWHMMLYPELDGNMPKFVQWLSGTHAQRWHVHRETIGSGHLYQGRYKSFPVLTDQYFQQVFRYVERNALRAGLVEKAEAWRWSSAWIRTNGTNNEQLILSPSPVDLPPDYLHWLNAPQSDEELKKIRQSIHPLPGRKRTASYART